MLKLKPLSGLELDFAALGSTKMQFSGFGPFPQFYTVSDAHKWGSMWVPPMIPYKTRNAADFGAKIRAVEKGVVQHDERIKTSKVSTYTFAFIFHISHAFPFWPRWWTTVLVYSRWDAFDCGFPLASQSGTSATSSVC